MRRRQNGITVTGSMLTNGSGITLAGMKFQRANRKLTPLKETMQNCVIIWPASLANHVAFLGAPMHWNVPCAYLFIVSTAGNFTNNASQIILLTSWTLLTHYFSHSLIGSDAVFDLPGMVEDVPGDAADEIARRPAGSAARSLSGDLAAR